MKKIALVVCALMLISVVACTTNDKNPNNTNNGAGNNGAGNNVGDEVRDDIDDALDINNNGANANNNDMADEETLTGTAEGYGGEVTVTVKVKGNDIISVEAMGKDETQGVGSMAIDELPDRIAQANSTNVDGVSGATRTSDAIKEAVDNALSESIQSKE